MCMCVVYMCVYMHVCMSMGPCMFTSMCTCVHMHVGLILGIFYNSQLQTGLFTELRVL